MNDRFRLTKQSTRGYEVHKNDTYLGEVVQRSRGAWHIWVHIESQGRNVMLESRPTRKQAIERLAELFNEENKHEVDHT